MFLTLPTRRLRGARTVLLFLLAAAAMPAAAQSLQCGTFKDASSDTVVRIDSSFDARRQRAGHAPEPFHLDRTGADITAISLASTGSSTWTLSADGHTLDDGNDHYVRGSEAACRVVPPFAPNSCRADIAGCMGRMVWAGADSWHLWCREGIEAACNRLIEDYRTDARNNWVIDRVMADPSVPSSVAAVCQEDDPAFDAEACRRNDEQERVAAVGTAFSLASQIPDNLPLPDERLQELAEMCARHPSERFCMAVADALQTAGQAELAQRVLQLACTSGNAPQACAKATSSE